MRRILVAALTIPIVGCVAIAQTPDADVTTAVLSHFAQRTDTLSLHEGGVILVRENTWAIRPQFPVGTIVADRDVERCPKMREFVGIWIERNSVSESAKPLLLYSERWQLIRNDDPRTSLVFREGAGSGEKVKTIATVTKPAFSPDGKAAFVLFNFTWSIHGADAKYLAEQTSVGWRVTCSNLSFYP
jgi:hypothetical protein